MKGQVVVLIEEMEFNGWIYKYGHKFTITDTSYRGWDLKDDDGRVISETLFIQNKFVYLEDFRDEKINDVLND